MAPPPKPTPETQEAIKNARRPRAQQADRLLKQLPLSERKRQQEIRRLIAADISGRN